MSIQLNQAINTENTVRERVGNMYDLPFASVWVTNADGEIDCVAKSGDVYDLLDDKKTFKAIKDYDTFSILTCGWAAPLESTDENTPPSQHPERRRVRLLVHATEFGVATVLRFQDDDDEIITDEGQARGSLADAVMGLMDKKMTNMMKRENK